MDTISKEQQELLDKFYRFFETADESLLAATVSKDLKDHDRGPMFEGTDYEALLSLAQSVSGLTEMKHNLTQIHCTNNDKIIVRWEASAKHTGETLGHQPTGRTVYFNGHDILHLKNGVIVEMWHIEQLLQLSMQMQ